MFKIYFKELRLVTGAWHSKSNAGHMSSNGQQNDVKILTYVQYSRRCARISKSHHWLLKTSFKSALTPHRRGAQLCKLTLMNAVHTKSVTGIKMLISSGKVKLHTMLVNEREIVMTR